MLDEIERREWFARQLDDQAYLVSVPVYCARVAAVQACRQELDEMAAKSMPLLIDEIRIRDSRSNDYRLIANAIPQQNHWSDALLLRLRGGPQWQIAVEQSSHGSVRDRLADAEKRAKVLLTRSQLAGQPFGGAGTVKFPMAPKDQFLPEDHALKRFIRLLRPICVLLALLVGLLMTAFSSHEDWAAIGWLVGLVAVILVGLWSTESHVGRAPRWVGISIVCLLYVILNQGVVSARKLVVMLPVVQVTWMLLTILAALLLIAGWRHLFVLRPRARQILSFGALTALISISGGLGAIWLALASSALGLKMTDALEWPGLAVGLSVVSGSFCLVAVSLAGAIQGWMVYFRLWGSQGVLADLQVLWAFMAMILLVPVFVSLLVLPSIGAAHRELTLGEGLLFEVGPADRACIIDLNARPAQNDADPGFVQTVVRGAGGRVWLWGEENSLELSSQDSIAPLKAINIDSVNFDYTQDEGGSCTTVP
ncbi:MAG: hypothetical protein Q4G34_07710 [Micrococcus sp.]|nr:hypothetical protein [Micrococcus sp.]